MVMNIRAFEQRVGRARCDRVLEALGKLPDGFRDADLPDLLFEAVPCVSGGPSRKDFEVLCVAIREDGSPLEKATDNDGTDRRLLQHNIPLGTHGAKMTVLALLCSSDLL